MSEANARESHDVIIAVINFDSTKRNIIDGQTYGFCRLLLIEKLIKF
ncbi:MAG: hypothetical protein H0U70_01605 [Tatlockia sp.]|nr:hypothetical protein [Tatlockia sp.]